VTAAARRWLVTFALVGVAAVWGATFVMVKNAVADYPLYGFLFWRFAIATIAFVVLFPRTFQRFRPGTVKVGILAGLLLTAGYVFQTWGLQGTSPSKAAFITGMFVVITPFLQAVVLRRPPSWPSWLGIGAAVAGLWLLSGGASGGWNAGDTRVLLCAVAYSAHMIVLGSLGREHDSRPLTFVQLAVCCVLCGCASLALERPAPPATASLWIALLITGVLASAVAFAVQTYAQRLISPTRTALILILEPAFGGLFGWLLAHEVLGLRGWAGAALILVGMAASEVLATIVARPDEVGVLEPSIEGPPAQVIEHQP
jgi:drug/metabolite transporter (DMT)-like permease